MMYLNAFSRHESHPSPCVEQNLTTISGYADTFCHDDKKTEEVSLTSSEARCRYCASLPDQPDVRMVLYILSLRGGRRGLNVIIFIQIFFIKTELECCYCDTTGCHETRRPQYTSISMFKNHFPRHSNYNIVQGTRVIRGIVQLRINTATANTQPTPPAMHKVSAGPTEHRTPPPVVWAYLNND